jgi:hypothetical protein
MKDKKMIIDTKLLKVKKIQKLKIYEGKKYFAPEIPPQKKILIPLPL